MKTSVQLITAVVISVFGTAAFADGFKCEALESGYNVKLFNHVHPELGTRTPAALIVSDVDAGTLLVRKGDDISKTNRKNTVRYTVEGSRKLGADTAILQVTFKQGKEVIAAGDVRPGQLILIADGEKEVHELSCERYLKQD